MIKLQDFKKITDYLWEIPKSYRPDMRVPARVYATEKMLEEMFGDKCLEQLINIATLPGIQKYALAMPDAHEGYGFPIGGVAAFDQKEGIISPGGIGYDVNCGVRLLSTELTLKEIKPKLKDLSAALYHAVPSGVGRGGNLKLKGKDIDEVLKKGAKKIVEMGYGDQSDLDNTESNGQLSDADPRNVSPHAKKRGSDQVGTMGAGNHFVELDVVDEIFDEQQAKKLNLQKGQIVALIHTGSRGLGHQIATDYIKLMMQVMPKYGIKIPDRELACAPFNSEEGQDYWRAMCCGANYAWANRQMITHEVREAWQNILGTSGGRIKVVYDVAHNLAKVENGLVVHRKGATRSFPDQPVLIPGSMGTASYVLVGQQQAMDDSFGSCCHGAGRRLSRRQAKREVQGDVLLQELESQGIAVNSGSYSGLAEEAPQAYKDVDEVVDVVHQGGLAKKVARLRPVAVIKG